jgi:hypothetical protein
MRRIGDSTAHPGGLPEIVDGVEALNEAIFRDHRSRCSAREGRAGNLVLNLANDDRLHHSAYAGTPPPHLRTQALSGSILAGGASSTEEPLACRTDTALAGLP